MPKRPLVGVALGVCLLGLAAAGEAAAAHRGVKPQALAARKTPARSHARASASSSRSHKAPSRKSTARAEGRLVASAAPELYGPFQPPVYFDHPKPPCEAIDAVVVAHVHEVDAETPELADVGDELPGRETNAWKRVSRKLSSFLRPKSAASTLRPEDVDLSDLLSAGVQIPVEGVDLSSLRDSFLNSRGRHAQHLAIDIGAPKGTPVLAAADGQIMQIRREKRGGNALYQKDASGKYLLYYCHLSRYVKSVRPGDKVKKGDVIAYVGATGHVIGGSHLHFSITRLPEDDENFKAGVAINPYLLFVAAVP